MQLDNGVLEPVPQLTDRQLQVLRFIWRFFRDSETYPTHREIATGILPPRKGDNVKCK